MIKLADKKISTKKLALAGVLIAVAVVGSTFSFPIAGSKCAPVQHFVNVVGAVFLGPVLNVIVAFIASLIRNLAGLGSPLAFPGSMVGALLSALVFKYSKKLLPTLVGEVFGTGVLGGMLSYPIAIWFMGKTAAQIGIFTFVVPFLVSTIGGSIIAGITLFALKNTGAVNFNNINDKNYRQI